MPADPVHALIVILRTVMAALTGPSGVRRTIVAGGVLCLSLGWATETTAAPWLCFQPTPTPEEKVSACTRLIEGGEARRDDLARAHFERGKARRYLFFPGDKIHSSRDRIHYREALADFDAALRLGGDRFEILSERGRMHGLAGEPTLSTADFDVVISLRPDDPDGYVSRGYSTLVKARGDGGIDDIDAESAVRALNDFEKALQLTPDNKQGFNGKAFALRALERYEEAILTYTELIKLYPNDASAIILRASAKTLAGDMDGSIRDFSAAIMLQPDDADLRFSRGNIHLLVGKTEEALRDYRAARALRPSDPKILRMLRVAEGRLGEKQP